MAQEAKSQAWKKCLDDFISETEHKRGRKNDVATLNPIERLAGDRPKFWTTFIVGFGSDNKTVPRYVAWLLEWER